MNTQTQKEMYEKILTVMKKKDIASAIGTTRMSLHRFEKGDKGLPKSSLDSFIELYNNTFTESVTLSEEPVKETQEVKTKKKDTSHMSEHRKNLYLNSEMGLREQLDEATKELKFLKQDYEELEEKYRTVTADKPVVEEKDPTIELKEELEKTKAELERSKKLVSAQSNEYKILEMKFRDMEAEYQEKIQRLEIAKSNKSNTPKENFVAPSRAEGFAEFKSWEKLEKGTKEYDEFQELLKEVNYYG